MLDGLAPGCLWSVGESERAEPGGPGCGGSCELCGPVPGSLWSVGEWARGVPGIWRSGSTGGRSCGHPFVIWECGTSLARVSDAEAACWAYLGLGCGVGE